MSEDRFDRIEAKLDKMSEAITTLARMEERMIALFSRMDSYDNNQRELGKRVNRLENLVGNNGQALRFAERAFWVIASAGIGYLFWLMKG